MEIISGEIIEITDADWAAAQAQQSKTLKSNPARLKGVAIDVTIKRLLGERSQEKYAPIDMVMPEINIKWHEIKSTTGGPYISISPKEKELADQRLETKEDTLVWVFDQGPDLSTFKLLTLVRYSRLNLKRSLYDMWVLERGEWTPVKGWFFYRATAVRNGELL